MRYDQLYPLIDTHKPRQILEVGTWNGHRAMAMVSRAMKVSDRVHYVGFDMFATATDESDARELNVKMHNSMEDVHARLQEFSEHNPGFTFELHEGDTRVTLPQWANGAKEKLGDGKIGLAFIDGGHSIETIDSDFSALKDICNVVVLDDFYSDGPDTEKYGCNKLLSDYDHYLLPQKDPVAGGGFVQMAVIPREAWPENQNIVIKTRNCVPDDQIQANIKYACTLTKNWIKQCNQHGKEAVIVSGGPSFKNYLPELRSYMAHPDKARIFCVKTSHDFLIENGIVPWGCFLLDPRPHVLDFVQEPHPDINYFTASMCHPVTLHRLVERKAKIWGYHAHVGAGEENVIKKELGEGMIIGGGSTAAVRGISVLHSLGFRKFTLIGFDSCYSGPDERVHGVKSQKPIFKVECNGKGFWTDAELLAQAQDFEKLLEMSHGVEITVLGEGMVHHLWQTVKPKGTDFNELFNGLHSPGTSEHSGRT